MLGVRLRSTVDLSGGCKRLAPRVRRCIVGPVHNRHQKRSNAVAFFITLCAASHLRIATRADQPHSWHWPLMAFPVGNGRVGEIRGIFRVPVLDLGSEYVGTKVKSVENNRSLGYCV